MQKLPTVESDKKRKEKGRHHVYQSGKAANPPSRLETMVQALAEALNPAAKMEPAEAAALVNSHQSELLDAAWAHSGLVVPEAFSEALGKYQDAGTKQVLRWLRDLHGFVLMKKYRDWYLMNGRLSVHRAEAITDYINNRLMPRLLPHMGALVDACGLRDELVRAPIALGEEAMRQAMAREHEKSTLSA